LTERDLNFDTSPELDQQHTGFERTLEEVERGYIEEVLLREGWRVEAAAKRLGIPRSSLYQKIKDFGILRPGALGHPEAAADRGTQ
jgi:DNA-binding NtrC family response regulator